MDFAHRAMVWSTGVKVNNSFPFPSEMLNKFLFNLSIDGMTLLDVPVARKGQMEIDMMAISRTPRAELVQVDPFWAANLLERVNNVL